MAKTPRSEQSVDSVIHLTRGIKDIDHATLTRLHSLIAATLETKAVSDVEPLSSRLTRLSLIDENRATVRIEHLAGTDRDHPPLHMVRVDEREDLIEARIAGPLSALGDAERLGPFVVDGARVWFNFYRPARRFTITESGASSPAFVISSARQPLLPASGPLTLDLQAGTIWIRGDLLTLPCPWVHTLVFEFLMAS